MVLMDNLVATLEGLGLTSSFPTQARRRRALVAQNQDSFSNEARGDGRVLLRQLQQKRPLRRQNQDSFSNEAQGGMSFLGSDPSYMFVPVDLDFSTELLAINADEVSPNSGRRPLRRQNQDSFSNQAGLGVLGYVRKGGRPLVAQNQDSFSSDSTELVYHGPNAKQYTAARRDDRRGLNDWGSGQYDSRRYKSSPLISAPVPTFNQGQMVVSTKFISNIINSRTIGSGTTSGPSAKSPLSIVGLITVLALIL